MSRNFFSILPTLCVLKYHLNSQTNYLESLADFFSLSPSDFWFISVFITSWHFFFVIDAHVGFCLEWLLVPIITAIFVWRKIPLDGSVVKISIFRNEFFVNYGWCLFPLMVSIPFYLFLFLDVIPHFVTRLTAFLSDLLLNLIIVLLALQPTKLLINPHVGFHDRIKSLPKFGWLVLAFVAYRDFFWRESPNSSMFFSFYTISTLLFGWESLFKRLAPAFIYVLFRQSWHLIKIEIKKKKCWWMWDFFFILNFEVYLNKKWLKNGMRWWHIWHFLSQVLFTILMSPRNKKKTSFF